MLYLVHIFRMGSGSGFRFPCFGPDLVFPTPQREAQHIQTPRKAPEGIASACFPFPVLRCLNRVSCWLRSGLRRIFEGTGSKWFRFCGEGKGRGGGGVTNRLSGHNPLSYLSRSFLGHAHLSNHSASNLNPVTSLSGGLIWRSLLSHSLPTHSPVNFTD